VEVCASPCFMNAVRTRRVSDPSLLTARESVGARLGSPFNEASGVRVRVSRATVAELRDVPEQSGSERQRICSRNPTNDVTKKSGHGKARIRCNSHVLIVSTSFPLKAVYQPSKPTRSQTRRSSLHCERMRVRETLGMRSFPLSSGPRYIIDSLVAQSLPANNSATCFRPIHPTSQAPDLGQSWSGVRDESTSQGI
jgi:hypothetical protein